MMSDVFSGMDREDVFVVECSMDSAGQRAVLSQLIDRHDIDVWSEGIPPVGQSFKMLLEEQQLSIVLPEFDCRSPKSLAQYHLERLHSAGDVESPLIADLMFVAYNKTAQADDTGFFASYQSYISILKRLDAYRNGPGRALISKFGSLGKSVNGRSIPVLHLKSPMVNATRPILWYRLSYPTPTIILLG